MQNEHNDPDISKYIKPLLPPQKAEIQTKKPEHSFVVDHELEKWAQRDGKRQGGIEFSGKRHRKSKGTDGKARRLKKRETKKSIR